MGGLGSGRRYQNGRDTVVDYRKVDVRKLKREGVLDSPGYTTSWAWWDPDTGERNAYIVLSYEAHDRLRFQYKVRKNGRGEWKSIDLAVPLEWTPCNFGGERPWFHCPGKHCGRRCAILYLDIYPLCRECLNLTYPSCNESGEWDRLVRKLRKLAEKLEASRMAGGPVDWPVPDRPKHMHRTTYRDLVDRWRELQWRLQEQFIQDALELKEGP